MSFIQGIVQRIAEDVFRGFYSELLFLQSCLPVETGSWEQWQNQIAGRER